MWHPYKFIRLQKLFENDYQRRIQFCEKTLNIQEASIILENIIWTAKVKFKQNGIFNGRNAHYWSTQNPHSVIEVEN